MRIKRSFPFEIFPLAGWVRRFYYPVKYAGIMSSAVKFQDHGTWTNQDDSWFFSCVLFWTLLRRSFRRKTNWSRSTPIESHKQSKQHGFLKVQGLSNHTDTYVRFSFTVERRLHIFLVGKQVVSLIAFNWKNWDFLKWRTFKSRQEIIESVQWWCHAIDILDKWIPKIIAPFWKMVTPPW